MTVAHQIFVADDHPIIQEAVRGLLRHEPDLELVGSAANGDDACAGVLHLQPDLLILDLSMPGLPALDVIAAAHEHSPKTKILILSAFGDRTRVRLLRDAGIDGYLLKDEAPELLLSAVHTILGGDGWFSRAILDTFMTRSQHPDSPEHQWATLTGREQSLLRLIGKGLSFRQIARQLEITEQSVRNYCTVLYSKLGVKSRSQAIVWIRTHASDLDL